MCLRKHRFLAFGLSVCLLSLIAKVTTEQATAQQPSADGLLRSEIWLAGHGVTVAFAPTLKADDPANRGVVAGGSENARVRVGQLVTRNGTLRLGTLDLKKADREGLQYDLWLEGTGNGWQLQVAGTSAPGMVGKVALARQASAVRSPTFAAALIPTHQWASSRQKGPSAAVAHRTIVDSPNGHPTLEHTVAPPHFAGAK